MVHLKKSIRQKWMLPVQDYWDEYYTALPAIRQYSFFTCPSPIIAFSFEDVPHSCRKCCKSVGMQGDDLDSLVSNATNKGINIVSGSQAAFDPMTGNIELASNSKVWEFCEEFLHKNVAQGWKKDDIGGLTQQLRKVKDYKGYKSVKAPAIA